MNAVLCFHSSSQEERGKEGVKILEITSWLFLCTSSSTCEEKTFFFPSPCFLMVVTYFIFRSRPNRKITCLHEAHLPLNSAWNFALMLVSDVCLLRFTSSLDSAMLCHGEHFYQNFTGYKLTHTQKTSTAPA